MALMKCPECGREVSDKAAACPHCGTPIAVAAMGGTDPTVTQLPPKKKTSGCLKFLLVIVTIGVFASICSESTSDPSSNGEPAPEDHSTMAVVQCQNFVRDRLRAPSTADFPFLDRHIAPRGDDRFVVTSYVDAQNAFGAMIRNNFVCDVQFTGGDEAYQRNWTLHNLQMD